MRTMPTEAEIDQVIAIAEEQVRSADLLFDEIRELVDRVSREALAELSVRANELSRDQGMLRAALREAEASLAERIEDASRQVDDGLGLLRAEFERSLAVVRGSGERHDARLTRLESASGEVATALSRISGQLPQLEARLLNRVAEIEASVGDFARRAAEERELLSARMETRHADAMRSFERRSMAMATEQARLARRVRRLGWAFALVTAAELAAAFVWLLPA